MIVQRFIGNNGFEACIEKSGLKYRAGWKSPSGSDFTFVCCKFKKQMASKGGYRYKYKYNLSELWSNGERKSTWTTLKVASEKFHEMVKNHTKINCK